MNRSLSLLARRAPGRLPSQGQLCKNREVHASAACVGRILGCPVRSGLGFDAFGRRGGHIPPPQINMEAHKGPYIEGSTLI